MKPKKLSNKKITLVKIKASAEALMDAEQIAIGGYAPLKGFMCRSDFDSVLSKMRLSNGQVWSLPVTLDVSKKVAASIQTGDEVLLTLDETEPVASLIVEDIYPYQKSLYCKSVFGTTDSTHPGVAKVMKMQEVFIGGTIKEFLKPLPFPMRKFMFSPQETRAYFRKLGWKTITGFHTRNVVHRAHEYLQRCVMEYTDGILIHPVMGSTKAGDFKKELVIKSYRTLIGNYYPKNKVYLAALAISMKFAGPRAAVFHALVRKNYGCTHIVIGRDHAGVGGYYDKYAAHKIFSTLPDLGITPLLFKGPFYCKRCQGMATENTCAHEEPSRLSVSGTLAREFIKKNKRPPEWLMRPEITDLFTGLGKRAFS